MIRDEKSLVLVANCGRLIRAYLRQVLSLEGRDVVCLPTVQDSISAIKRQAIDLILVDVDSCSSTDDRRWVELIVAADQRNIPAIVMSSLSTAEHKAFWLNKGAADFISKPLAKLALLARTESHLRARTRSNSLAATNKELSQKVKQLERLAITDGLTGLYNHRFFQERLKAELRRARRHGTQLSLAMCDIDHFKRVNDVFGHQSGDAVLGSISRVLKDICRASDLPARYGGEEFIVILPETNTKAAYAAVERMRGSIQALEFSDSRNKSFSVTASFGIATLEARMRSPSDFIECVDSGLYMAKQSGRNRTVIYGSQRAGKLGIIE